MKLFVCIAACAAAGVAALCVWLPEPPKFEAAVYFAAVGIVLAAVAHFVPNSAP